jgi:hypothetical protein
MNMPTKQTIIDNIDSYTPENLVDFIQKDIIAYSDIIKEASCSHTVRESVKDLLEKAEAEAAKAEAEAWTALQANPTLDAAENFLKTYPQSSHREDVLKSRKGLMDDAAWNAVNQTDISSLETFVNNNAGNSHIGEAQTKIEELQWNKVDKTDISALVTFITNNAGNSHIGEAQTKIEELQWNAVDKKNPTALSDFINKYPSSTHKQDAVNLLNDAMCYKSLGGVRNALINEIVSAQTDPTISDPVSFVVDTVERYINGGIITKKDFVEMLSEDNNLVNTSVLNTLKGDKILQPQDFLSSGFDQDFVNMLMKNPPTPKFSTPQPLTAISSQLSDEVYFWGLPSSGKSAALGAILSVANSGDEKIASFMEKNTNSQGYDYMNKLSNLFHSNDAVCTFPPGTDTRTIYEMNFKLYTDENVYHDITFVDLAGELFRCMYNKIANLPLNVDQTEALTSLYKILVSNVTSNQKIHVFVIEYGAENREYEGLPQKDYLDGAVHYIADTGILKKNTDQIYVLVTKADKVEATDENDRNEKITKYLYDEGYASFLRQLQAICKKYEINGGHLTIMPFSLGKVCFQDYLKFDSHYATVFLKKLLKDTKEFKDGKSAHFLGLFKK